MSGNTFYIIEDCPLVQTIRKVIEALGFIQPIHIKHDHGTECSMLTDRRKNLARRYFHHLCLMRASVDSLSGIIGIITLGSQIKFTKTNPCLSIVFRNGHMSHVTIGKDIIPYPIGSFHFRQRSSITPEEQQASVFQTVHGRHRNRAIERRRTCFTPSQATVFREGFIMIILRSTHNHPQASIFQFDDSRFYRSMIPTDSFVETSLLMIRSSHYI